MNATGRCLCGAVSFRAEVADAGVHVCHCSICRRWAGGPLFAVAIEPGGVTWENDAEIGRFASSDWAERGFCRRCGTHLFYRLVEQDQYILEMGTFDDVAPFAVASEIYIDDKPAGYAIAGEHPRLTGEQFLASMGQG